MERYEHQHALIPEDIRVPPFVPAQPALPPKVGFFVHTLLEIMTDF